MFARTAHRGCVGTQSRHRSTLVTFTYCRLLSCANLKIVGKGKVHHPRTGHEDPEGKYTCIFSFFNLGTTWGGWTTSRPGRFTSGKENPYPLCRRLDGPKGRSGRVRNISSPIGNRSRTVQPVASNYTD